MATACVILAAGMGKRMRSKRVKVLHELCGAPMIDYPVSLALQRRCRPVVVVVGSQRELVEQHLRARFGKRVRIAVQDPPLGTGHAVLCARRALGSQRGKLLILYGDVPLLTGKELGALARASRKAELAFLTCRLDDPTDYGRVIRDGQGEVVSIVEQRDASRAERRIREVNSGIYLVDAAFAFRSLARLGRGNAQGEYYLTDLVAAARGRGLRVEGVEVPPDSVLGVNDRRELARVGKEINRRLLDRLMASGVSVLDPDSTFAGAEVRIGTDSLLLPGCVLRGQVRIGRGCTIGPGAVIEDARIGDGAEVRAYSVLEGCRVGAGATVGPFARLRPGTVLEDQVRVGNFVECKKAHLGRGTKAGHLSYLGDAEIGRQVNVGAGTITCNYDGEHKHTTRIDDGAFIGSDTQLVAPVRVGRGAYVGAGTTVTRDVPAEALAVSRARQRNVEGYARRKARKA
ncbi:MAG: bifunctional UDP-N-acetylglucosamine diphosphorylase/glucosamine-1-phosphate N-acetyltransferase GlmU [Deltaproteobacteria bacterium]|nr:bifunctional UDP-N-acetylglucosamine diphosphorylase/glucosamine-1-phosphate N-acetyltransferase GlmU [Deltaproteobacteria bacterium]